ncbi:MAG: family transcriptional regulator, cyclic receptor protein [Actinomycetota bacterium]|jgi:CRP-like cAMP-binding protein|nr:family transcriptional regulator, cyclic receptor protein [Actinomycetota bacterium]
MRGLPPGPRSERRQTVATLAGLPTLTNCDDRELTRLADIGKVVTVPADWPLIQERTPGDTCYLILDGSAEVLTGGTVVATLAPGALVGEIGLLDSRLRTATVVTRTRTTLLSVGFGAMQKLLSDQPHLADALLADYHRREAARTAQ